MTTIKVLTISIVALFICFFGTIDSQAATVGYTFEIFGDLNVPDVKLTNDSTVDSITQFTMTIGDTAYNFDAVYNIVNPSSIGYTLNTPDASSSGGVRSNIDDLTFTGLSFSPGDQYQPTKRGC